MAANATVSAARSNAPSITDILARVLAPLASLKLTVGLFAASILLIFFGTLANTELDMWEVKKQYFESYIVRVSLEVLINKSFFPTRGEIPYGFYFPGGAAIGMGLIINLVAAHLIRFRVQARGTRLLAGLFALALGVCITSLVIVGGQLEGDEGLQGQPLLGWSTLWLFFKLSLVAGWFGCVYAFFMLDKERMFARWGAAGVSVGLLGVILYLLFYGEEAALSDSSMRILWQLVQATFAGGVLLGGCILLFNKRAGIVVMHGGVALLMFSEFWVSLYAVEEQMPIAEGQAANFTSDIRTVELAVIDTSGEEADQMVVVPRNLLLKSRDKDERISHASLPFDIETVEYYQNARLRDLKEGEQDSSNPATAGCGTATIAEEIDASTGTESEVDQPCIYVRLFDKTSGDELGVHLLSVELSGRGYGEPITAGGKTFETHLRYRRTYQPFSIALTDFERKDYMGTSKARDFRSHIHLTDPEKNIDLEQEIWMNNPMRYGGKTFYQSSFFPDGSGTVLSVVTNTGWMIPYVSCMIVAVGMFFHFGLTLTRFLRRRTEEEARRAAEAAAKPQRVKGKKRQDEPIAAELVTPALPPRSPFDFIRIGDTRSWVISGAIAMVVTFLLLGYNSRYKDEDMDLKAFGSLPVMYQGRIKPIDTLARNSLKIISNRDYLKINDDEDRVRAVRWLLDLMSQSNGFEDHHVFRIDNPEIKQALNLPKRKGHRYSVNEIRDRLDEYSKLAGESRKVDAKERSLIQRRFVELDNRVRTYTLLMHAFQPTPYPPVPTEQLDEAAEMRFFQTFRALRQQAQQRDAQLGQLEAPLLVPPSDVDEDDTPWLAYSMGADRAYFQRVQGDDINPFTLKLTEILAAYSQGQSGRFNKAVGEYYVLLDRQSPADLEMDKVGFESFYNSFAPFLKAMILNIVAFVIVGFAFLAVSSEAQPGRPKSTWPSFLNRTAFLIIVGSFAIQSIALVSRIYISGRPPVTNLYSSAILIGWAAVLVCILVELLFRYGIGNAIATICGWSTLLIARFLAADGDTFTVLQAVLDTQFWLATHVVCITLGYATTFLAGAFGIFYIFGGFFTKAINKQINREFCRIIYSVLCFSIFFSFVGTVLGGLWADDSWGRFWGWDPKENGALIIVLWNALVLHARWGNMVRDRGMAVLAVGGNIVTAWSWFGVNELGVGLHSYGFTDGVLFVLGVFIMSQLAIIAIGCAPRSKWRSDAFRTT